MTPTDTNAQDNRTADEVLLLTDTEIGMELAGRLENEAINCITDPYDALIELSKGNCSTVIVSAPRDNFTGLAKAIRRLNSEAKVLAFCRPDDNAELAESTEGLVDEYCSFPPTRGELTMLLRTLAGQADVAVEPQPINITGESLKGLLTSVRSAEAMEAQVAEIISAGLESPVKWVDASACPAGAEPLLMLAGEPARLLIPEQPVKINQAADALIADLHQCLPPLVDISRRMESLHRLAITDHLTGAYNRRYFYRLTDHVLQRAGEEGFRATLLLYDIDDFKKYNDQYGHAVGDEILRDTAAMIQHISREQDIVARIGGDEFAVLFWDEQPRETNSQPLTDIWAMADRFRQAVADHAFQSLGPDATGMLTISGGLAGCPQNGATCLELLQEADRALRTAKQSGKNAICLVGETRG